MLVDIRNIALNQKYNSERIKYASGTLGNSRVVTLATSSRMDTAEIVKASNLAVLRSHDPCCDKLIYTSPICDIYEFNTTSDIWEQIDCKGSFFLYSRISQDAFPYAILVLNRQGLADFNLGITPALKSLRMGSQPMDVDLQDATIMIQISPEEVYGLWLFEVPDREKVLNLIRWCIKNGTP